MKDAWYDDRADLVKWGTMVHLARREGLGQVVQVAFLRSGERPVLTTSEGSAEIPGEVWEHFRDVRCVEELGRRARLDVRVFDRPFDPLRRENYAEAAIGYLRGLRSVSSPGKAVLLDPDTGLEPKSGARAEHVSRREVERFWAALEPGDRLVLYQHAYRKRGWHEMSAGRFAEACAEDGGPAELETFQAEALTRDVALFAARKGCRET